MNNDIQLVNIQKSYGETKILQDFNLTIPRNEITCIIGPSGCGKSTTLNIISRLVKQDSGKVINADEKLISYVFQEPRLLPWKSAQENLSFVLKDKLEQKNLNDHIQFWLEKVGLSEYKDFYPRQMSGGMMQRLALARAFAMPCNLLLMDEPFKGLDAPLRHKMIELTQSLWSQEKKTIVFVTHDIEEALLIGHRVIALSACPAHVLENINVPMSVEERKIGCKKLVNLQAYLYNLIEHGSLSTETCAYIKQTKDCIFNPNKFL